MTAKVASSFLKILAVVSTTLVAPVLVYAIVQDRKDGGHKPHHVEQNASQHQESTPEGKPPVVAQAPFFQTEQVTARFTVHSEREGKVQIEEYHFFTRRVYGEGWVESVSHNHYRLTTGEPLRPIGGETFERQDTGERFGRD
jgi:hypothetical protein